MAGVINNSPSRNKHRLVWTLETQVNESETSSFEVGEQRERNHRYYSMEPLGTEQKGRSHYISPDVLDAVEGKKAVFSETFLSARDVVKFTECPYPGEADAKTAYTNQIFKQNNYERLFRDGWHDAFVAKRIVVLAEWLPGTEDTTIQVQGTPVQVIQQQLQQMGALDMDPSGLQIQTMPSPQGPMDIASGELVVTMEKGSIHLTLIQPERFFRDPDSAYEDQGEWSTIEEDMSRGKLIALGYDREQVDSLAVDYRFRSEEEDAARKRHDSSWTRRRQHNRIDEQETVSFYRTWTWLIADDQIFAELELDFEPEEGEYLLYEIHWSHGEVMKWEDGGHAVRVVESSGIFDWSEMKISHAENGMCTADVMAHNQKTTSHLKRLIIDNQQMANASRTLALSGAVKNPRDLVENKIGATIWSKRLDAVAPLPTPALSPLTMETLAMLKADGEERSGISGLAKGMNTDAVKYQNADNMIERLTTAGQRRVTAAARDFANTFLVPLAQYIVKLGMENDQSQSQMEIGGQMMPIAPQQWQDTDSKMDVAVALTPDEGQRMGQQLLMMNSMLTQDPSMAMSYGVAQKHALYDMVFDLMGVSDTSKILLAPSDPQFQQAVQQQQQESQKQEQKQDQVMGVQLGLGQAQIQSIGFNDNLKGQEFGWKQTNEMADNMREDEELEHDKAFDYAKLEVDKRKASG